MSYFNIRVVLHDATYNQYEMLASAMASKGMYDVVKADNGGLYRLPPGEYATESDASIQNVRDAAAWAANSTGARYSVRVTQGPSSWVGLEVLSSPREKTW